MSVLRTLVTLVGVTALVSACNDSTSPSGRDVTVQFAVTGTGAASAANHSLAQVGTAPLEIAGSNGTLEIDRIAFIVTRLEFEQSDDACESDHGEEGQREGEGEGEQEDCEEFRLAPKFVDLSLPGGVVNVATSEVPEGTWTQLKFRVKNLDFNDDDNENDDAGEQVLEDNGLNALLGTARAAFANWPRKASLVVEGSFRPNGATTAIPFTTFFDGEIKVKMELQPPLELSASSASPDVRIELDPARWFRNADGSVVNLSAFDFAATQRLVEFRLKMREGFLQVRLDD